MPMLEANGTLLHYHVAGKGVPIVCIHPPLLNRGAFRYQEAELADRFRIVTFDLRGHGRSAPSPVPLTYTLLAEDLRQVCIGLGLNKPYLCGYSTGAGLVLEAMLTDPDRYAGGILISGMSELTGWYNRARVRLAKLLTSFGAKRLMNAALSAGNADSLTTFGNLFRGAQPGQVRAWKQYFAASMAYSCTDRLGEIKQPMLLLYGEKDRSFRRYARLLHERLPDSQLKWIEHGTHQIPIKQPLSVNAHIRDWLIGLEKPADAQEEDIRGLAAPAVWEHAEEREQPLQ
ncbi:hydrolase [Paenibacillus sp. J31TS4]|uniref:alpha/beta fold hydrolase n=1 Tax=Paenibacillus sp. J31TS4 TaxID=2807195 RepID=UPI001B02AC1D|nr:alpha/beta hydrolase [Paenibacillus sp. J31TS4]GIP39547.1 hydrolase [Paenibacillus sp. J31TS4]